MRLSMVLGAALLASFLAATKAPAQEPTPPPPAPAPGIYRVPAAPISADRPTAGELLSPREQDVKEIDVEGSTVLQVVARHTNNTCRIWIRLLDVDSTELGRAAIPAGGSGTVTALVPATSRVLVVVDSGPFDFCAGAAYELTSRLLTVRIAGLRVGQGARFEARDYLKCLMWSKRAEQLSVKIERTKRALLTATGAHRNALKRKLRRLRHDYREAKRKVDLNCDIR
jgi:hypothetical protein